MAFYEAAAQVIPLLFLALLVDRRLFEPADQAIDPGLDTLLVGLFVVGEATALYALGSDRRTDSMLFLVVAPLAFGAALLIGPILAPRLVRAWGEAGAGRFPKWLDRALVAVNFVLTLGVLAFAVVAVFVNYAF